MGNIPTPTQNKCLQLHLSRSPSPSPASAMNLTPQCVQSPLSPYNQQSKQSFSLQRPLPPATPQPDSGIMGSRQTPGLGLMGCLFSQSQSTVQEMPPSPHPSGSWSQTSMVEQDFTQSSQPPDLHSAAFDPFSGYSTASNTGMISEHTPEPPGPIYCQSPPSSNLQSHSSSISSPYSLSEPFSPRGSELMYAPKVKEEDPGDLYSSPGNEQLLQELPINRYLYHTASPVNTPGGCDYKIPGGKWPRADASVYPIGLQNSDDTYSKPGAASFIRTRPKRHPTRPDEATHECSVCGKLFKRSYNYKSHMETHNPQRKYPHVCTAMVGNTQCTKKFQRKTDLDRHNDSVSSPFHVPRSNSSFACLGPFEEQKSPLPPLRKPLRPARHSAKVWLGRC